MPDEVVIEGKKGLFYESAMRNPSKIRKDRAEQIVEDTEMIMKREIEDLERDIVRLQRDRNAALDLSGDNALSTKPLVDFDSKQWILTDVDYTLKIREKIIRLNVHKRRYNALFEERYTSFHNENEC